MDDATFAAARFQADEWTHERAVEFVAERLRAAGLDVTPTETRRLLDELGAVVRGTVADGSSLVHTRTEVDGADVLIDVAPDPTADQRRGSFADVIDLRCGRQPEEVAVRVVVFPG